MPPPHKRPSGELLASVSGHARRARRILGEAVDGGPEQCLAVHPTTQWRCALPKFHAWMSVDLMMHRDEDGHEWEAM